MRICMTLEQYDFPPHVRVENEASRLLADGHEVMLVCRNLTGRSPHETWNGMSILRIERLPRLLHYLDFFSRFVFHFNFQWYFALWRLARAQHFDVFHVNDLPLAGTVLALGRRLGVPVILDLYENYPVALPFLRKPPQSLSERWMHSVLYGVDQWKRYERKALGQADRIIVVVDEGATRIQRLGVPSHQITVVGNTLNVDSFDNLPLQRSILDRYAGHFVISYIGSVARYRRLDTLIRAMPLVHSVIPNARLVIVGDLSGYPEYAELASSLGLTELVDFEGWRPFDLVPSYLAASAVGVLPQERNEQTDNSMPNKLFYYFYMERPIVVTDCSSLQRMVDETGGGVVAKDGASDPRVLAEAIISLKDERVRRQMGERGRRAVAEKYNWEVDEARLSRMYRHLESEMGAHLQGR